MNRKYNDNRGKRNALLNLATLILVIVGLSVYFTVQSLWQLGTIAVIVLLTGAAGFYFWLWRFFESR